MGKSFKYKLINFYSLLSVCILAIALRFVGLNWDQNQHLHPDERFLTMVTQAAKIPTSLDLFLDPAKSTLNPYNVGYDFYVYGTLPLTIVKAVSSLVKFDKFDYNNIALIGRFVSALFDLGILILIYKLGNIIFNKKAGILAGFIYTTSVLPLQLSHFYAVDTFLLFFLILSFYFLTLFLKGKSPQACVSLSGASLGLALASKISAILFLPIAGLVLIFYLLKEKN